MTIKPSAGRYEIKLLGDTLWVDPGHVRNIPLMIRMKKKDITDNTMPVTLNVYGNEKRMNVLKEKFLAPVYD